MGILKKHFDLLIILFYIVVIDLILGGSGNLIKVGPLSFRMIIFGAVLMVELFLGFSGVVEFDIVSFLFIIYLTANCVISMLLSYSGFELVVYRGFLPLCMAPFFIFIFRQYSGFEIKFGKLFRALSTILAIASLILFAFCFIRGPGVYSLVEVGFLRKYSMGNLAFVGRVPRLFLKTSVFICIGYFLALDDFLHQMEEGKSLLFVVLDLIAIATTFTVGLVALTAFFSFIILFSCRKIKDQRKAMILSVFLIFMFIAAYYFTGVHSVFEDRFSGSYTFSYKGLQFQKLLYEGLKKPLFGQGIGHTLTTDYGFRTRTDEYFFEVMWMQIFMNLGIVGFLLFLSTIVLTLIRLYNLSVKTGLRDYMVFGIGIAFLALFSFSNPILNNTIGLTYIAICIGLSHTQVSS